MNEREIPWREILAMIYRRRMLVLSVFAIGLAFTGLRVWFNGPAYRATATIMVMSNRARVTVSPDAGDTSTVDRITDADLNSEVALLKAETLVREVLTPYANRFDDFRPSIGVRIRRFFTFPLRLPGILYRRMHGVPPLTLFDDWVQDNAARVEVTTVPKSNLIRISYAAGGPEWAARIVNELVAKHIGRHTRRSQQSEALHFYESQRELLAEKSSQAEVALQEFYVREGIESVPERRTLLRTRMTELEATLGKSETELAEGNARVTFLAKEIRNYPKQIASASTVKESHGLQVVKPRIMALELQRSELLSRYAPTSVKIKDIDRQIMEAKRLLGQEKEVLAETTSAANPAYQSLEVDLAQTRAQVAALNARVETSNSQIDGYKVELTHLDEIASEQERLEQELRTAKEAFLTYTKKEEAARFSSALDQSSIVNIAVAEPAEVPATPEQSRVRQALMMGALFSLLAAVAVAFVVDRLDPAVKGALEAERVTGFPVIGEVVS